MIVKLKLKKSAYKKYVTNTNDPTAFPQLSNSSEELVMTFEESRNKYFMYLSNKLPNPLTPVKSYWSILLSFLFDMKTPVAPPIYVNGKFITEIKDKCDYFSDFLLINVC